ncbi:MAG: helix-turn-helix domain-containing protein [Bacteroides sp.]|nr:helix-turn-helix domain-containing protein [Bacteroides sp.]MDD2644636.1 helix-turn-helix domain-containing protein [Bacteroides sp.]MDD4055485.1 helix-turn-helix domain-containing protein [Bacteroides sp.]MDD4719357.1 helix-turn-helix domain-containing protein [Bacteroides sp.]NLI63303.1 AraC family transcriptional regulator [Bacteroidales bacterium]
MNRKFSNVSFKSIADSSVMIKHFMISDISKVVPYISLNHPITFDGMILAICLKGKARIKINFREYKVETNSVITVTPNCVVEACETSSDLTFQLLLVSIDFLIGFSFPNEFNFFRSITINPVIGMSKENIPSLLLYFDVIEKKFNEDEHLFTHHIVRTMFFSLLLELAKVYYDRGDLEESELKSKTRGKEICEQFFKLLIVHHKRERKAKFYAEQLCITSKYLSATLKQHTGKTVSELINDAVIVRAKLLLKTTSDTVLEVSERLNFSTPSFFGRYFKQYTSMTPLEYRESN